MKNLSWLAALLGLLFVNPTFGQVSAFDDAVGCPPLYFPATFFTTYFAESGVMELEMYSPEGAVRSVLPTLYNSPLSFDAFDGQAYYTITITRIQVDEYDVEMMVEDYPISYDNLPFSLRALDSGNNIISSETARLLVNTIPAAVITNPVASPAFYCEGSDLTITTTVASYPDFFQWQLNGVNIPGAQNRTLTLTDLDATDAGNYQLLLIDFVCGTYPGPIVNLNVLPSVNVTDVDMVPKPCNAGETVTFAASADNVDLSSSYTWIIDGISFTALDVPSNVVVNGNTLSINSIDNVVTGISSVTSTIEISNISAPGSPAYSADVQLEVSNNLACVGTAATVMSSTTTVFPVEWLAFAAKARDAKQVDLHWATASETNNELFIVERSVDAKTFQAVGEINGMGTTAERQDYTFLDDKLPAATRLYYRVKQVDYDGQYSYSALRSVDLEVPKEAVIRQVYQQGSQLNLSIYTPTVGPATVELFDLRGVRVYRQELGQVEGNIELPLQLPAVSGMYVLRFRQQEVVLTRKVVLTR